MATSPVEIVALADNVVPGNITEILTAFYANRDDAYDFFTYLADDDSFQSGGVHGIFSSDQFGNGTSIRAVSALPGVRRVLGWSRLNPLSLVWSVPDYTNWAMGALLHEVGHQWGYYAKVAPGYGFDQYALLKGDHVHESYYLMNVIHPIDQMIDGWEQNPDGTYFKGRDCKPQPPTSPASYRFSRLTLFFMGLATPEEVPPVELFVPDVPISEPIPFCVGFRGHKVAVPMEAIIRANGYNARVALPFDRPALADNYGARQYARSGEVTVPRGQTRWVWLAYQNTGFRSWTGGSSSEARLGFAGDPSSAEAGLAYHWSSPDRLGVQVPDSVFPGGVALFSFQVTGTTPGTYRLPVRPVIDGVSWMDDVTYVTVTVTIPECPAPSTNAPTSTVYLPNITRTLGGPTGWQTPFIVQNVGTANATLEVTFYSFATGACVTRRTIANLVAGASFAESPNHETDLPADSQFSVVVKSYGSKIVSLVNEHQGVGARAEALSYNGLSTGATKVSLPYVAKFVEGWLTTFVMQNLGPATAQATISLQGGGGGPVLLSRVIAPGAAAFVNPALEPQLARGVEYAVTITSDQPIGAIANAHNDTADVAAPRGFSYNGALAATSNTAYAPYVARNAGGRSSRLVIQNAGTSTATPQLTFVPYGAGSVQNSSCPQALAPGASCSIVPQIADGEYAATVGGGTFALLVATQSATDAMGYVAQGSPQPRSYLPNVTRRLGGASGWTTPIIVQSTGATGVMLRWYRFSDSTLVMTQTLDGLSSGAARRIDPRDLALADDTQYAVVADGVGGTIVAIVTELNFQGGDGAMAYEGFPAAP